jgi:hypothetical protein
MNTFNDSLLIVSAPPEMLFGLAVFFCVAGMTLFLLSVEQGNYLLCRRWVTRAVNYYRETRGIYRRGWVAPEPCATVGGGH